MNAKLFLAVLVLSAVALLVSSTRITEESYASAPWKLTHLSSTYQYSTDTTVFVYQVIASADLGHIVIVPGCSNRKFAAWMLGCLDACGYCVVTCVCLLLVCMFACWLGFAFFYFFIFLLLSIVIMTMHTHSNSF